MLKFRADLGDSRKHSVGKASGAALVENGKKKKASSGYEEIVLNNETSKPNKEAEGNIKIVTEAPLEPEDVQPPSPFQLPLPTSTDCQTLSPTTLHIPNLSDEQNVSSPVSEDQNVSNPLIPSPTDSPAMSPTNSQVPIPIIEPEASSPPDPLDATYSIPEPVCLVPEGFETNTLSLESIERQLHQAVVGLLQYSSIRAMSQWAIPETDSEDDYLKKQQGWAAEKAPAGLPHIVIDNKRLGHKFNLPSDSEEEEDPYSTAKSPSMSIKSMEPPLPPPVSTIPRTFTAMPASPLEEDQHVFDNPPSDTRRKVKVNAMVDIRKKCTTSTSDTDPYDEVDYTSEKRVELKEGQSQPRYKFSLSKSKSRLNPIDTTYAEIPRKAQWNFPSSSDEEEVEQRRPKKVTLTKLKGNRRDSSTSEEGDRPCLPPKIWEDTLGESVSHPGDIDSYQVEHSTDNGVDANDNFDGKDTDITIEYSAFKRTGVDRKGSLLGQDDHDGRYSPTGTNLSSFEENNDMIEVSSVHSENSCKVMTDYEQSSTCVDMDQLSLDSSGKRPKRIVETHETHEIVPAENNEDDIVERIIETQTITEKLDDNRVFNDYCGEDYSKYLENDDEFVSHIFTLGRTLEKGSKKKKPKDFAFVENPFSAPDPVIETMPLEKKTVKQKITTLVKKKKARDDENIYAEVKPTANDTEAFQDSSMFVDEDDDYNHTNDCHPQGASSWDRGDRTRDSLQANRTSNVSNDSGMVYEALNDIPTVSSSKSNGTTEKKKEQKRSLLKGIKKLLKKKDKNQEVEKADDSLVLEDDYQEYVP